MRCLGPKSCGVWVREVLGSGEGQAVRASALRAYGTFGITAAIIVELNNHEV